MKEHFQDYGVRKWAGDDLIELQSEPLAALQTLVAPYAPCIVSGCEVTPLEPRGYAIAPGLVALPGKDAKGKACVKLARFAGVKSGNDEEPYYLTLTYQTATRTYMDGKSKAIAYDYTATPTRNRPEQEGTFLEIGAEGEDGKRLVDRLGITQKLDQEGGDASKTIVEFAESTDAQPELTSHSTLGKLIGQIKKLINNKVDAINGKGLSEKDFTAALKEKLEGIEDGANKYVHPTGSGNLHIPAGGLGGQYLRAGLNGNVLWGAGYTHPTGNGNNHIPAGGSSGQVLRYSAAGVAQWGTVGWEDVIGKPSTFTPTTHNQGWDTITGKPSTFTPTAHNQGWDTITGKPSIPTIIAAGSVTKEGAATFTIGSGSCTRKQAGSYRITLSNADTQCVLITPISSIENLSVQYRLYNNYIDIGIIAISTGRLADFPFNFMAITY